MFLPIFLRFVIHFSRFPGYLVDFSTGLRYVSVSSGRPVRSVDTWTPQLRSESEDEFHPPKRIWFLYVPRRNNTKKNRWITIISNGGNQATEYLP